MVVLLDITVGCWETQDPKTHETLKAGLHLFWGREQVPFLPSYSKSSCRRLQNQSHINSVPHTCTVGSQKVHICKMAALESQNLFKRGVKFLFKHCVGVHFIGFGILSFLRILQEGWVTTPSPHLIYINPKARVWIKYFLAFFFKCFPFVAFVLLLFYFW